MEDKNNNMGDFLRKKFDDFDETVGSWGKPDKQVKASVLEQITANPTTSKKGGYAKFIYLGIAALLVLTTGGYLWNLHQQNSELKNTITAQANQITAVENQLKDINQKHEATTTKLNQEAQQVQDELLKKDAEIERLNQSLLNERSGYQKSEIDSKGHLNAIAQLEKEKQVLLGKLEEVRNGNINGNGNFNGGDDVAGDLDDSGLNRQFLAERIDGLDNLMHEQWNVLEEAAKNQIIIPASQILKSKHQRFKIGYEFSPMEFELETDRTFERQRSPVKRLASKRTTIKAHGALFAYSPKRNWWIRTGFRVASFETKDFNKVVLAYDASNEYVRPGFRVNELSMSLSNPYAETESSFDIAIPDDTELNEEDLLEIDLTETQSVQIFQIPFGVEYIQGKNKLQWLWQGGLQWNNIVFDDYNYEAKASSRRQHIEVEKKMEEAAVKKSRQFMSAYAGVGMNYHLTGNWHAKAAFTYNYDFINNKSKNFSNATKRGTAFNLGLNYHF